MMTIWFSFYLVSGLLILSAVLSFVDGRRKRTRSGRKCISVLVPCYNDARTMPDALAAIKKAMGDRHSYEILVADDGSTDNSRELLSELCDGETVRLVVNPRNLGKSETLNRLVHRAAHELILFMDADTLLHEKALEDMLSRLAEEPKLGAVSCPYQPLNRGILANLQALDYSMIRMVQASYNLTSGLALLIGYGLLSLHGVYTLGDKVMLAGNAWEMFRLLDAWMPLNWAFSLVKWWYRPELMRNVYFTLCFMMLSGVYVLPLINRKRELVKLLWIVP